MGLAKPYRVLKNKHQAVSQGGFRLEARSSNKLTAFNQPSSFEPPASSRLDVSIYKSRTTQDHGLRRSFSIPWIVRPQMHVNSFCRAACTGASTSHPDGNSIEGMGKIDLENHAGFAMLSHPRRFGRAWDPVPRPQHNTALGRGSHRQCENDHNPRSSPFSSAWS
jgi:hypothetical protein